ncbi:cyclic nucleotide-binding domain-containing protein [Pelagibius litoralis]|uniref:Cyclic nucleotide-binding domain-containing protein n=1 Tax=Pelagibius litoralis TaxID=374515 RepID=A0A967F165_9PROT|nr:cyclic nucleotide-binding domain-containing protein [Pelagibius litoralis]NIA71268.1 cyclic nucleotide-binding domain-containing protein [Pelagibius litoralis]
MAVFDVKHVGSLSPAVPREGAGPSPCSACEIRSLTICAPLNDIEQTQMAAIVSTVELQSGNPLFDEGEPADHVFNVTAGTVKVYKLLPDGRRQVTGFLFAGDFLGLANQETYAYSAEAVTLCNLCRFPRRKLENLMERFPRVEQRLLNIASNELAAAQDQMLLLGRKTAREKIASFLILLARRARQRGVNDNPVFVPMSRTDIGDFLGLTTETVSRTFTQLKKSNLIRLLPDSKVELSGREDLEEIAGGF